MRKRIFTVLAALMLLATLFPVTALAVPQKQTPDYKVAFFPYDCYHMQDENGKRSGYGYEMMQGLSRYLQCTFSYVGYDKTAAACIEMLRAGELDLYTAASRTAEREQEFVFSTHPSITSYTCMNVKVGNRAIVSGDYSTYNGIRVGLLQRHTYNNMFLRFVEEKGFDCEIVYYETPTELSNALVNDEVDALVNSYIQIPEDEQTIETFGETPYFIIARKEDQALIDAIDYAFDRMNVETPNWRTELYNRYYGSIENNLELTQEEQALLQQLVASGTPIRGLMNPQNAPYAWYENGEAYGITAEIFRATAEDLNLPFEFVPVSDKDAYAQMIAEGATDIWIDMNCCDTEESGSRYKTTNPYLTTTLSVLRSWGSSDKISSLVVDGDSVTTREIISKLWPDAKLIVADDPDACKQMVLRGEADGALLMSYTAQKLAMDDVQNRLRVDIVPGASMSLLMGVNANADVHFYGLWEKTLARVADQIGAKVVQEHLEAAITPNAIAYLYDHPTLLTALFCFGFLLLFMITLYCLSVRSKRKQEKISGELAAALDRAEEATNAKQEFFSKMSHDIRTPLNVVLGMTQIAHQYKDDGPKLENALDNITQEGNYLLTMINSILDVNQLEHGTVVLAEEPFNPAVCLRDCVEILGPLSQKKEQHMTVSCDCETRAVRGDVNRLKQILVNIISNAIKYTNMGGTISLRLACLPDNRYRFTCQDNGIGMSEAFIQHICEGYTRAEDSRISKIQGTGLGMSVVKGFTDLMGGTLEIHSKPGVGSTFSVTLQFPEASPEEKEQLLHASDPEKEKHEYIGKKVLLVEDNALNAEIAVELLNMVGLSVDWAENGLRGIERFENSRLDEYFAIFMDMQMPVMDGVTATKRIRASKRADHDIPIFAMTANTFASDRRSCQDAGMNGYISKPVSVKDIEHALTEIE